MKTDFCRVCKVFVLDVYKICYNDIFLFYVCSIMAATKLTRIIVRVGRHWHQVNAHPFLTSQSQKQSTNDFNVLNI